SQAEDCIRYPLVTGVQTCALPIFATPPFGMGFDIGYSDVLRDSLRQAIAEATGGRDAHVNLDKIRDALYMTYKIPGRWTAFQCKIGRASCRATGDVVVNSG